MADIIINPAVGKIDFFSVKGDNVTNTLKLTGNTLLVTGPLSASSISTGGGGAFVTSVQPTVNYLSKFTGNSTIANSVIYDNGTNVGIGTTSPAYKLHVEGTGTQRINVVTTDGASAGSGIYFQVKNAGSLVSNSTLTIDNTGNLKIFTGTSTESERMRITSTGCVGIGTTSVRLNSLLDVYGSGVFGTSAYGFYIGTDATGTFLDAGTQLIRMFAGQSERIRIATDGNVGIGTSSPLSKLQINTTVAGSTVVRADGTSGTLFSVVDDLTDSLMSVNNSAGLPVFEVFADDRIVGGQYGVNDFVITNNRVGIGTSNPLAELHVTSSTSLPSAAFLGGNVGVGTTSPIYPLDIPAASALTRVGSALIGSWPTTTSLAMFGNSALDQTNAANYALLQSNQGITYLNAASGQSLRLRIANADKLIIDSGGNVGIGTTSFVYGSANRGLIELYGSSDALLALRNSTGNLYIQKTSADVYINNTNSGIMSFATSNAQRMVIFSGGSVSFGSAADLLGSPGNIYLNGNTGNAAGPVLAFGQSDSVTGGIGHLARITGGGTSQDIFIQSQGASNSIGLNANPSGAAIYFQTQGAEKARITAAGNLGIGTSTPATKVDIYGPVSVRGTTVITTNFDLNAGNAADIYGNIRVLRGASLNDGMYIGYGGAGGNLKFFSNSGTTEFMTIATTGNVGIGSTSPAAKLDIVGTNTTIALSFGTTVPNNPLFINTYGGYAGIGMDQTTAGIRLIGDYSGGTNPLVDIGYYSSGTVVHANWVNRLRVLNNGNVGIGTTSPITKLQVRDGAITAGTTTSTSGTTMLVGQYTDGNLTVLGTEQSSGGPMLGYGVTPSTTSAGAFLSSTGVNVYRSAYVQDGATHRWYTGGVQTVVFGSAVSVSEKMRINLDGNLGIGTSSPLQILHVNGSILLDGVTNGYTQGATRAIGYGSNNGAVNTDGFSGMDIQSVNAPAPNGGNYSQNVRFWAHHYGTGTGNTPRMVIQYNGNLGVGTTGPNAKLESYFSSNALTFNYLATNLNNTSPIPVYSFDVTNGVGETRSIKAGIGYERHLTNGRGTMHFYNDSVDDTSNISGNRSSAGDIKMSIDNAGNVGIGTTVPNFKFEIGAGSSNAVVAKLTQGYERVRYYGFDLLGYNDGNLWMIGNNATNGLILGSNWDWDAQAGIYYTPGTYGAAGGSLEIGQLTKNNANFTHGNTRFYTNGVERMRIISTGNVGIGTSSPGAPLTIYKASNPWMRINGGGAFSYIQMDDGTSYGYLFKNTTSDTSNGALAGAMYTYTDSGKAFQHIHSGVPLFTILSGGNVGIGTTVPSANLQVGTNSSGTASGDNSVIARIGGSSAAGRVYNLTLANTATATVNNDSSLSFIVAGNYSATGVISALLRNTSTAATDLVFTNYNNALFERMRIQFDGNIGIGTSSPSYKLDVNGESNFNGVIRVGTVAVLNEVSNGNDIYANIRVIRNRSSTNADGMYVNYDSTGTTAAHLRFYANGQNERMRIDASTGNVGIGTTSPGTKLAVNGVSSFGLSSKLSMIGLDINSSGTPTYIKIVTTIPVASPSADFTVNIKGFIYGAVRNADISISWHYYLSTFYNPIAKSSGGWAPTIRLSAEGGFVAIVLSSPGYWPKFYVESMYSSAYTNQYASGWSWTDADATGNPIVNVPYANNFGNGFVMLTDGNVGIGTTAPATLLHVDTAGADARIRVSAGTNTVQGGMIANTGGLIYAGSITNHGFSLRTNDADRVRIQTDGNVGIGTTAPGALLQVGGSSGATATPTSILMDNTYRNAVGGNTSLKFYFYRNGGETYGFGLNNASGIEYHAGSSGGSTANHAFYTETTEKVRINSAGNLGIGTTAPANKLQVVGDIGFSGGTSTRMLVSYTNLTDNEDWQNSPISIRERDLVGNAQSADKYGPNINFHWANRVSYSLWVNANGILNWGDYSAAGIPAADGIFRLASLQASANIGIGTTSPAALLNIRASAPTGATSAIAGTNLQIDSNASSYISFINTADNGTYAGLVFTDNNNGGYIVFRNYTGDVATGSDSLIYGTYQDHIFQTGTTSGVNSRNEVMRIKNSGYVGINTNNPTGRLHIVQGNSGGVAAILLSTDESTIQGPSANTQIRMGSNLVLNASNVMPFNVNASETMRIINNGNIGIGTTTPLGKLHVYGLLRVGGAANEQTGIIALGNDANAVGTYGDNGMFRGGIGTLGSANYTNISSYQGIVFNVGNAGFGSQTTRMLIDVNGNVGIGTTGPVFKLDVNGTSGFRDTMAFGPSIGLISWGSMGGGTGFGIRGESGRALSLGSNGNWDYLVINTSGNVGIGTTSPLAKLQVNSTTAGATLLRADGTSGTLFSVTDDLNDSLMSVNNSAGLPVFEVFADDRIVGGQYGANDFVVRNNKVGIGTNNPIGKLHVTGSTSTPAAVLLGDVGIGTTAPTAQANYRFLQVNGPVSAIIETTVGGTRIGGFDSTSNILYVGSIGSFPVVFRTAVDEKMRITANGNIGIGTSSPNSKLTIVGDGTQNNVSGVLRITDTGSSKWGSIGLPDVQSTTTAANNYYLIGRGGAFTDRVLSIHIPNAADYGSGAQPKFGVYSTGSDLLASIEANTGTSYFKGNVGIGIASPTQKLDVAGSIYTSGKLVQKSTTQSLSGTTGCTIDLANGAVHILSLSNGTTISSFTYNSRDNNPSVNTLMLVFKYAGTASVTFTNVIWANGVAPTLTGTNGYADVFMLTSYQGGAGTPVWIGTVVAQALVSTNL